MSAGPANVFSVDLEEWFNFEFGGFRAPFESWGQLESRLRASAEELLALLADSGTKATFFALGWVAERHPALLRQIADAGHEVGSHSYAHRMVSELDRQSFAADLRRARGALEDVTGQPVQSFRAPMFSIRDDMGWAFETLAAEGIRYDSSLFPARRLDGGAPGAKRRPHRIDTSAGSLLEYPITLGEFGGVRLPVFGGGYFRLAPVRLVIAAARALNRRGIPVMFYIHPHDLDPGQPRPVRGALSRFRRYYGLSHTARKLRALLGEVRFTRLDHAFPPA